jgi:predicted nucleic acid-binding protein
MAQKTDAYVDTSALIAALDRSDSFHPAFARLFAEPPRLVTSALVVAEGHGWFLRRYDQRRAMQFLNFIQELAGLDICPFDQQEFTRTLPVIKKFSDQKLTLADAHGLSILAARRIKTCWSTDRHLGLTGATLVM